MALYLGVACTLTVLAAILAWHVAPATGLVRTVYSGVDSAGQPLLQDRNRTANISLAFLDEDPRLPRQFFSVSWAGFWFLPEGQAVALSAGGDNPVEVLVDRVLVLQHDADAGTDTTSRRIMLDAGPHELIVRYEHADGDRPPKVLQVSAGGIPGNFPPTQLFPRKPDARDFWIASRIGWLYGLVAIVWAVPPALALLVLGLRKGWWVVAVPRTLEEYRKRVFLVVFPALLGPVVLFLVGPHTLYQGNPEFNVAFATIAVPWLVTAVGVAWLLLLGAGCVVCLLSNHLARAYAAALLALGVLLWAQGTFLVPDVGPLFGEGLDLARYAWRAPYEAGLWIAGLSLAVVFARPVSAVAPLLSQVFIALQVVALTVSVLWTADDEPEAGGWSLPPEQVYQLSGSQNVIHIVLDGFLSEIFGEVIERERTRADREFSGFVFYADHLGAFPTTRASMPAMLTGAAYRNEMPFNEFLGQTTHTRSIATVLAQHGYRIRSITFDSRDHPPTSQHGSQDFVRYVIPTPYSSYRDYVRFAALQLLDLSLFRHAPQGLKSYVYNDQAWLVQTFYTERNTLAAERAHNVRPSNHAAFLEEFASRLTVTEDEPVYTFIHVALPHPPTVLDENCSFVNYRQFDRENYTAQARCALVVVQRLLDRLRSLEIYDQSAVILTADHGWLASRSNHPFKDIATPAGPLEWVVLSAMPLLAIKPSQASGPLRVSYAPTAITDVPATIMDLAGLPTNLFPGESALRIDPDATRLRSYAFHSWEDADWNRRYLDVLRVFSVRGHASDPNAWSFDRSILDPSTDTEAQHVPDAEGSHRAPSITERQSRGDDGLLAPVIATPRVEGR